MIDSATAHRVNSQWHMHGLHGDRGYGGLTFTEYTISLGYTVEDASLMVFIICKEGIDKLTKVLNQHTHTMTQHLATPHNP